MRGLTDCSTLPELRGLIGSEAQVDGHPVRLEEMTGEPGTSS